MTIKKAVYPKAVPDDHTQLKATTQQMVKAAEMGFSIATPAGLSVRFSKQGLVIWSEQSRWFSAQVLDSKTTKYLKMNSSYFNIQTHIELGEALKRTPFAQQIDNHTKTEKKQWREQA
jgi:hypothetical protein